MFDVTFLESHWTCIFGHGCQGVLTAPTPERGEGCCSYGAHLTGEDERQRIEQLATELTDDQWQNRRKGRQGTTRVTRSGDIVTRLVGEACIFLNRPDFARGAGCAFHVKAMDEGRSYVGLKPEVCWQLPLHRDEEVLESGHVVTRIEEWGRRGWGPGGDDFHWWCTEAPEAFTGRQSVADSMDEELRAMVGDEVADLLRDYLTERSSRGSRTRLAHPVVRRRS